jgi:hypothetical protein
LTFHQIYANIATVIDKNPETSKIGIKKLIDPVSGSTLYIKKFKNSPLSQVSATTSFDIPSIDTLLDNSLYNLDKKEHAKQEKELSSIKKNIQTILNQSTKNTKVTTTTIQTLAKQNKQLTLLCYATLALLALNIFF